jgi:hypothetical protein
MTGELICDGVVGDYVLDMYELRLNHINEEEVLKEEEIKRIKKEKDEETKQIKKEKEKEKKR